MSDALKVLYCININRKREKRKLDSSTKENVENFAFFF